MAVTHMLKDYSLEKPVISIICVFLICSASRIIDIFILRLDEPPVNEILLSKVLGLIILLTYLRIIHSGFRNIGFNTSHLMKNIFIGGTFVFLGLAVIYGSQYGYLMLKGANPYLAIQHHTLLSIFISVIAGNIVNALMEEGLFRGAMTTQFVNYVPFWKANAIQAAIFGIWHIVWPIKDFYLGKVNSVGAVAGMCAGEIFITFLMGFTMGYLFYTTGSIWTAFTWHFVMNFTQNILVVRSNTYSMESAIMNTSATAVKGIAFIVVLILTCICAKVLFPSR